MIRMMDRPLVAGVMVFGGLANPRAVHEDFLQQLEGTVSRFPGMLAFADLCTGMDDAVLAVTDSSLFYVTVFPAQAERVMYDFLREVERVATEELGIESCVRLPVEVLYAAGTSNSETARVATQGSIMRWNGDAIVNPLEMGHGFAAMEQTEGGLFAGQALDVVLRMEPRGDQREGDVVVMQVWRDESALMESLDSTLALLGDKGVGFPVSMIGAEVPPVGCVVAEGGFHFLPELTA
jgi:hypothetical protein